MIESFIPYIPHTITNQILKNPEKGLIGEESRIYAAILFADVSGFTAISEALAKAQGRAGAEELTSILNSYFDPMIQIIDDYGGVVGKFGGDAMTVFFPCQKDEDRIRPLKRALKCAVLMQQKMADFAAIETSIGQFSLSMKIGISAGNLLLDNVGTEGVRTEFILAGDALDKTADAEHHAEKGEIFAEQAVLIGIDGIITGEERHEFILIRDVSYHIDKTPIERIFQTSDETKAISRLSAYLPRTISERLKLGEEMFINEHRKVTVLFLSFSGLNYNDDTEVSEKLQAYYSGILRIVEKYDGYINKVDMGDKGSKMIILFGAPNAHENDEERGVLCAIDIINQLSIVHYETPPQSPLKRGKLLPPSSREERREKKKAVLDQKIGVNTGFVFAGNVGSRLRQEYTVMGDAVNLSARLMAASAPNQVLISQFTQAAVASLFDFSALEPIMVKGKSEPIGIYNPLHRRTISVREILPMVGRKKELNQFKSIISQLLDDKSRIVSIVGEAGMGKSRLNYELIRIATENGVVSYGGECQSYGSNVAYLPWGELLKSFFELDLSTDHDEHLQTIETAISKIDPELVVRMPLLSDILGIEIPDNDVTKHFEADLRKQSCFNLIGTLIKKKCKQHPILLVFEDLHWIDSLSMELINYITRNITNLPLLMVMVYRPLEEPLKSSLRLIHQFPNTDKIKLKALSPEESVELINSRLDIPQLPDNFKELVLEKSQGNPFYVEELTQAMKDTGTLKMDKKLGHYVIMGDIESVEVPDNLQSLILSRIDRLGERNKMTLKIASVIGRIFRMSMLKGVYPTEIDIETLRGDLAHLDGREFTHLDKLAPELEYLFKHIITREVAYETLLFAHRRQLHEKVASFIESYFSDEIDDYTYVLANHYGLSDNTKKKIEYYEKAGNRAKKAYDNDNAIYFYTKELETLGEGEPEKKMGVLDNRAQVFKLKGKYYDGIRDYEDMLEIAKGLNDVKSEVVAKKRMGAFYYLSGNFDDAFEVLEQALQTSEEKGFVDEKADCLNNLGVANQLSGNLNYAEDNYQKALKFYEELNQQTGYARTLLNIGGLESLLGNYQVAKRHLNQALIIYEVLLDKRNFAATCVNLGDVYASQGKVTDGLKFYDKALSEARKIGAKADEQLILEQLGRLEYEMGKYENAIEYCKIAKDIATYETQDEMGAMFISYGFATIYLALGDYTNSILQWQAALNSAEKIENEFERSSIHRWLGITYLKSGDLNAAQKHFDVSLAIATSIEEISEISQTENFMGFWHQEKNELEIALKMHQKAYNEIDIVEDEEGKMYICLGMASCLRKMQNPDCTGYAQKAVKFAPSNDLYPVWQSKLELGRCYAFIGKKDKGEKAYKEVIKIINTIAEKLSEENKTPFMTDKKEIYEEFEKLS